MKNVMYDKIGNFVYFRKRDDHSIYPILCNVTWYLGDDKGFNVYSESFTLNGLYINNDKKHKYNIISKTKPKDLL